MEYPVIISRELIALPSTENTVTAGRTKTINVVKRYLEDPKANKKFVLLTQDNPDVEEPKFKDVYPICTLCEIISVKATGKKDVYTIKFKSIKRMALLKLYETIDLNDKVDVFQQNAFRENENTFYAAEVETVKEQDTTDPSIPTKINELYELFKKTMVKSKNSETKLQEFMSSKSVSSTIDEIISFVTIADHPKYKEIRKEVLHELNIVARLDKVISFFKDRNELDATEKFKAQIDAEINQKVNENLSKQQKEFYLREKMKAVKEEIGKINPGESDINSFKKRLEDNPYPNYIKEKVLSEINKMESNTFSQENAITKQYIEWLLNLPYWQETKDNTNVAHAKKELDETHFGLEKVKERIVEYLAVRARAPKGKSPIICLVGPPGVGKTSLVKSIALALEKKFVKVSLGGVKDESEIRGHRRTYLGSMPGRIIKGMKQAGVTNPLFLLDEIDKMGSDSYKGDPSSALLEVLDPEQNTMFSDNYIEEYYDLSNVMFICTANYTEQIPAPLYDRLEIIELTSYTEKEKFAIAKNYLVQRVLTNTGLSKEQLSFSDDALMFMIRHYTREAGVRELERTIQKIARKLVVKMQGNEEFSEKIDTKADVMGYLGKIIYDYNMKDEKVLSGVVNGMAYTSAGGDLLPIEVSVFKGKAGITITGNLKETMKESAQVALGYVRSHAEEFGLQDIDFSVIDIHIHVPSGGIPKDGPSAGVTLTTAIISALKKQTVPNNIAMTGEITLRGKVGIIGGVREKVISAFRGGVTEFFIPKDDERFFEEIPVEIRENIQIHLVDTYDEIYNSIFKRKD